MVSMPRLAAAVACVLHGTNLLRVVLGRASRVNGQHGAGVGERTDPREQADLHVHTVENAQAGLRFYSVDSGGFGIAFAQWLQPMPIQIEVVASSGAALWLRAPYDKAAAAGARGSVVTAAGSRLTVVDIFQNTSEGFAVARHVTVQYAALHDVAFSSRFSLASIMPATIRDRQFFMPGVWYLNSQSVSPPHAIAADLNARHVLVREDRLPLPLVMVRAAETGSTTALVHTSPNGSSFSGEDFTRRLIDSRMQFGSVGVVNEGHLELVFQFPGSEGDRTYICCQSGWANRSHPLQVGVPHAYNLTFTHTTTTNYSTAVQNTWRSAFDLAKPVAPPADLQLVFKASMDLLSVYTTKYNGVPLIPFCANLSDGLVADTSSQMGFVGKATAAAALLLKGALASSNQVAAQQATSVIEFWVVNSMNPSGVPKTWFNSQPGGKFNWRPDSPYMGHLRIMSEGAKGILDAWFLVKHPHWLAYAQQYGDFIVRSQADNGSIAGEWQWDGQVFANFTNTANHPIPFLLDLAQATGDHTYQEAAVKAGVFSAKAMQPSYHYIGGACDNPNVMDKEAGVLAMQAFLALYDATSDRQWIDYAVQAATYCETWTYAWNVPIPKDDPGVVYPASRTTLGASLIAAGQSGADNFMAIAYYDYYRLYTITNDTHFLKFSRFLAYATKQVLDWDGTLHYPHPGLMNEAITLAPRRGHGVSKWLPWLTVAVLDPMLRMNSTYGTFFPD